MASHQWQFGPFDSGNWPNIRGARVLRSLRNAARAHTHAGGGQVGAKRRRRQQRERKPGQGGQPQPLPPQSSGVTGNDATADEAAALIACLRVCGCAGSLAVELAPSRYWLRSNNNEEGEGEGRLSFRFRRGRRRGGTFTVVFDAVPATEPEPSDAEVDRFLRAVAAVDEEGCTARQGHAIAASLQHMLVVYSDVPVVALEFFQLGGASGYARNNEKQDTSPRHMLMVLADGTVSVWGFPWGEASYEWGFLNRLSLLPSPSSLLPQRKNTSVICAAYSQTHSRLVWCECEVLRGGEGDEEPSGGGEGKRRRQQQRLGLFSRTMRLVPKPLSLDDSTSSADSLGTDSCCCLSLGCTAKLLEVVAAVVGGEGCSVRFLAAACNGVWFVTGKTAAFCSFTTARVTHTPLPTTSCLTDENATGHPWLFTVHDLTSELVALHVGSGEVAVGRETSDAAVGRVAFHPLCRLEIPLGGSDGVTPYASFAAHRHVLALSDRGRTRIFDARAGGSAIADLVVPHTPRHVELIEDNRHDFVGRCVSGSIAGGASTLVVSSMLPAAVYVLRAPGVSGQVAAVVTPAGEALLASLQKGGEGQQQHHHQHQHQRHSSLGKEDTPVASLSVEALLSRLGSAVRMCEDYGLSAQHVYAKCVVNLAVAIWHLDRDSKQRREVMSGGEAGVVGLVDSLQNWAAFLGPRLGPHFHLALNSSGVGDGGSSGQGAPLARCDSGSLAYVRARTQDLLTDVRTLAAFVATTDGDEQFSDDDLGAPATAAANTDGDGEGVALSSGAAERSVSRRTLDSFTPMNLSVADALSAWLVSDEACRHILFEKEGNGTKEEEAMGAVAEVAVGGGGESLAPPQFPLNSETTNQLHLAAVLAHCAALDDDRSSCSRLLLTQLESRLFTPAGSEVTADALRDGRVVPRHLLLHPEQSVPAAHAAPSVRARLAMHASQLTNPPLYFEAMCQLYYRCRPALLPHFVGAVARASPYRPARARSAAAQSESAGTSSEDKQRRWRREYFERALRCLPAADAGDGVVDDGHGSEQNHCDADAGRKADAMIALLSTDAADRPGELCEILLAAGRWDDALEMLQTIAIGEGGTGATHSVVFAALLREALLGNNVGRVETLAPLMPDGFGAGEVLRLVRNAPSSSITIHALKACLIPTLHHD